MSKFLQMTSSRSQRPGDFAPRKPVRKESTTVVETTPVAVSPTVVETSVSDLRTPAQRRKRLLRAVYAQDGHSLGEQAVYDALWRLGTPQGSYRIVQIGYDKLAREARLNERSVRDNLRSLSSKLAIEVIADEQSAQRQGKTYKVHGYAAILERRTRAGMEWIERNKGVKFVPGPHVSTTEVETTSVVVSTTGTGVVSTTGTGVETAGPSLLEKTTGIPEGIREPSSSIVAAFHARGVTCDDGAERRLRAVCRNYEPTATDEEIAHFVGVKLEQFREKRNVQNIVGLLLTSVSHYFAPPATELHRNREIWKRQREENERLMKEYPEETERV